MPRFTVTYRIALTETIEADDIDAAREIAADAAPYPCRRDGEEYDHVNLLGTDVEKED